ncbi:hypothetical protein JANLI_05920 [Janthinobacterium lividum]|nr:hypothetical protein JANLI_05920 [Janthinobacterium lividum]
MRAGQRRPRHGAAGLAGARRGRAGRGAAGILQRRPQARPRAGAGAVDARGAGPPGRAALAAGLEPPSPDRRWLVLGDAAGGSAGTLPRKPGWRHPRAAAAARLPQLYRMAGAARRRGGGQCLLARPHGRRGRGHALARAAAGGQGQWRAPDPGAARRRRAGGTAAAAGAQLPGDPEHRDASRVGPAAGALQRAAGRDLRRHLGRPSRGFARRAGHARRLHQHLAAARASTRRAGAR